MPRPKKYPDELLERDVRLVFESGRPDAHVAGDLGIHPEALRKCVLQAEADGGKRADRLTTDERERLKSLERENPELRRANEILKAASAFSPRSSTRPDRSERVHRRTPLSLGVEPICRTLDVSASAYYAAQAVSARPGRSIT